MPGDSGVTCMLVCAFYYILHTRPRAHRAPGIPCALNSERAGIKSKTRGVCAGEIAKVCLAVIARSTLVRRSPPSGEGGCDEAIHLSACCAMDCFAEPVIGRRFAPTRWLAMTASPVIARDPEPPHTPRQLTYSGPQSRILDFFLI